MSITKKALLIWWSLAPLMLMSLSIEWAIDDRTRMIAFRDMCFLLGFAAIWGNILAKLTEAHRNSKNVGATQ